MRVGICGCMVVGRGTNQENRIVTGIEVLGFVERLGFDYIELSLADIMRLGEVEFIDLIRQLQASDISCEVCHNFFPSAIRLTGDNTDMGRTLE